MDSDKPEDDSFAGLLRMYRRRSGLSQTELAEKARISSRAISDLERGVRSRAYHPTVEALAAALSLGEEERVRFTSAVRRARSQPRTRGRGRISSNLHDQRVQTLSDLVLSGEHRLISVTGPPGAGKTRLAIDAGRLLAERQSVRMEYLSLESCARAIELEQMVSSLPEHSRRIRTEVPEPYQKPRLLVLDNLEHLLPIDAEVNQILEEDPSLSVIVVSRVPPQIPGEREISLPPS